MSAEHQSQLPLEGFPEKRRRLARARRALTAFKRLPPDMRSSHLSEWSQMQFRPKFLSQFESWKHNRAAQMLEEAEQNVEVMPSEMTSAKMPSVFEHVFSEARRLKLTTKDVVLEVVRTGRFVRANTSDQLGLTRQYENEVISAIPAGLNVSDAYVKRLYRNEQNRQSRKLAAQVR